MELLRINSFLRARRGQDGKDFLHDHHGPKDEKLQGHQSLANLSIRTLTLTERPHRLRCNAQAITGSAAQMEI